MKSTAKKPYKPHEKDRLQVIAALPLACTDERSAVEFFEHQRWGDSPACPKCGGLAVRQMKAKDGTRNKRWLWKCGDCRQQYTVRIGTIMEESLIPLRHWAYAFWGACAGRKGVSALQIRRMTQVSYKSCLFMMHRIRFAMTPNGPEPKLTGIIEADETYVGGRPRGVSLSEWRAKRAAGLAIKRPTGRGTMKPPVVAVLQRGGKVRARVVPDVTAASLGAVIRAATDLSASRLMSDEARMYIPIGKDFAGGHDTVTHSLGEYVRGLASTNEVESFFALLKRALYGTHHAVSRKHLPRYLEEAAFRWNTRKLDDGERVVAAIQAADGKRLMYHEPVGRSA